MIDAKVIVFSELGKLFVYYLYKKRIDDFDAYRQ